jgi:hypothetical protein
MVNQYFSHIFKSTYQPSSTEEYRLSMKDSQALESIFLIPLEGVTILGSRTKVLQQWMAFLTALKLCHSQVSLWGLISHI